MMDLSSLQDDLPRHPPKSSPCPPPSPPPPVLASDFKAAALAVTKLYQNSARQIDLARQEGYFAAVQEVAALLSRGEIAGNGLREWCAVGLSRITAQEDEANRSRRPGGNVEDEGRREMNTSLEGTEFSFQTPVVMDAYRPQQFREMAEVTYEVVEGSRKRGVSHPSSGNVWDGNLGNKRSRHM
jgi:hypothetical protein